MDEFARNTRLLQGNYLLHAVSGLFGSKANSGGERRLSSENPQKFCYGTIA